MPLAGTGTRLSEVDWGGGEGAGHLRGQKNVSKTGGRQPLEKEIRTVVCSSHLAGSLAALFWH